VITIKDLRKVYRQGSDTVVALDGVSLEVPTGKIHGIVGHSGAGKSTLVRCLTLLDQPTSGTVAVNGQELTNIGDSQLRETRRRIGMVFQHANLFDSRTTAQNVAYPLELSGMSKKDSAHKVRELLELVGLGKFSNAYPSQLSGGQRQRVGIARALATDPDVLLCDEPTSALDPKTTDEILDLVKALRDRLNITVLIITHEMHVVKQACDSVSLLEAGRIVEHGDLESVINTPGSTLAATLLPLPGEAPQAAGQGPVLDIIYSGAQANEPVLSGLSRHFDMDVNVMAGSVEQMGEHQFARLRIQLPASANTEEVVAYLESIDVAVALKGSGK